MRHQILFLFAIMLNAGSPALAQLDQTIQLPSFGFTTVATTVVVPDRGMATLGSISSARYGRRQLGTPFLGRLPFAGRPFNNVGIGSERNTSMIGVTASIHDFEAMDQALRAHARQLAPLSMAVADDDRHRVAVNPAALSVAEIRRQQDATQNTLTPRQQDLLDRARQAESEGRLAVAKIYYRNVWRETSGQIKQRLAAKLAELNGRRSTVNSSTSK